MSQTTQFWPIALNLLAALLSAFGQYFYKIGSIKLGVEPIYKNYYIFSGILLFTVVMALFLAAYKLGGRLSITYPVYASTFIWGTILGIYYDKEPWSGGQAFGVFLILVGITFVAALSPR